MALRKSVTRGTERIRLHDHSDLNSGGPLAAVPTQVGGGSGGGSGAPHPSVGEHDAMGLATDAELAAHAATPHGGSLTVEDGGTPVTAVDHIVFDGATVTDDTGGQVTVTIPAASLTGAVFPVTAVFGDGVTAIPAGTYLGRTSMHVGGDWVRWTAIADTTCDAAFDVLVEDTPPGAGTSVVASAPPELSTEAYATSTTLTGWTVPFDALDVVIIELTIATPAAKMITLVLNYERAA